MNIDTLNAHCGPWLVHCPRLAQGRLHIHRELALAHWALAETSNLSAWLQVQVAAAASVPPPDSRDAFFQGRRGISALVVGWPVGSGVPRPDRISYFDLRLGETTRRI